VLVHTQEIVQNLLAEEAPLPSGKGTSPDAHHLLVKVNQNSQRRIATADINLGIKIVIARKNQKNHTTGATKNHKNQKNQKTQMSTATSRKSALPRLAARSKKKDFVKSKRSCSAFNRS
jgi:hypothetical protein